MKFRSTESFFPIWNGKNEWTHWQYPKICTLWVVCCVLLYKTSGQFCRKSLWLFRHHWHNRIIASVSGKLPLWICVNVSHAPTRTDIITTAKKRNKNVLYHGAKGRQLFDTLYYLIIYDITRLFEKKLWWDLVAPSNLIEIQYCWCLALTKYWNLRNRNRKRRENSWIFFYLLLLRWEYNMVSGSPLILG